MNTLLPLCRFYSQRFLHKSILISLCFISFLFSQTLSAQPCPTDLDIYPTVEEEGSGVLVTIHFDSDTWDNSTTLEVEEMDITFGLGLSSAGLSILDFGFEDPYGTMALSGVTLTIINGGNDLQIEHNSSNSDMPVDEITGPQVWFFVEGGSAGDFGAIARTASPLYIDYDGGPTGCSPTSSPSSANFNLTSNTIEGHIESVGAAYSSCSSQDIEGADVIINPGFFQICATTTDSDGDYSCNTCEDGPYLVCASAECEDACGLNNADVALGQQLLKDGYTDFYYTIAGDVDRNGIFNASDLGDMNRELTGQDPDIDWCRFIPIDDYFLEDINADNCTDVPGFGSKYDFFRIALGDLNGSCNDCVHGDLLGDFPIVMEENEDGVEIYVSDDIQLIGLDIHLSTPNLFSTLGVDVVDSRIETSILKTGIQISYWDFSEEMDGIAIDSKNPIIFLPELTLDDITLDLSQSNVISTRSGGYYIREILPMFDQRQLDVNFFSSRESTLLPSDMSSSDLTLEVYSLSGAMLYRHDVPVVANSINVNKIFPTGIYLMTFRSENSIHTKKIWLR